MIFSVQLKHRVKLNEWNVQGRKERGGPFPKRQKFAKLSSRGRQKYLKHFFSQIYFYYFNSYKTSKCTVKMRKKASNVNFLRSKGFRCQCRR